MTHTEALPPEPCGCNPDEQRHCTAAAAPPSCRRALSAPAAPALCGKCGHQEACEAMGCKSAPAAPSVPEGWPSVDEFAQHIRWLNGGNKMGAGALAEKLLEWLQSRAAAPQPGAHGAGGRPNDQGEAPTTAPRKDEDATD